MTHTARIAELSAAFTDSMARFLARLDAATSDQLTQAPADGGWSAVQVAWHVAATNEAFAGLIDGSIPTAKPAPADFAEMPWSAIATEVPAKLDAPARFHPPAHVGKADALSKLRASEQRVIDALAGLGESRANFTVKSIVGTPISLYQVGNWAAAHVARHNAQAKRVLGA